MEFSVKNVGQVLAAVLVQVVLFAGFWLLYLILVWYGIYAAFMPLIIFLIILISFVVFYLRNKKNYFVTTFIITGVFVFLFNLINVVLDLFYSFSLFVNAFYHFIGGG